LPEIISNTSPLQYLHQLGLLSIMPALATTVIAPTAVAHELAVGRQLGVDVPNPEQLAWISIREPAAVGALVLINDLGPGETEVLMLGLEMREAVVVLDDALARQMAVLLKLRLTGTLGLLLDAKRQGLISVIEPLLDQLDALRFRLSADTRAAVLRLAGEASADQL
jgi:uncharacterized protein